MFAGRSFAAAPRGAVRRLSQHAHDVAFLHDQQFLAVELDLGTGPFAEQHAVADLEVDRDQLAGFIPAARTYRRDFALRGLFLGAVGNDDATLGLFFSIDTFDHDTVMQWAKCGFSHDGSFGGLFCWSICRRKRPWNTGVFDTAWGSLLCHLGNQLFRVPITRLGDMALRSSCQANGRLRRW